MNKCIYCGADTILYYAGQPICVKYDDEQIESDAKRKPAQGEKLNEKPKASVRKL